MSRVTWPELRTLARLALVLRLARMGAPVWLQRRAAGPRNWPQADR